MTKDYIVVQYLHVPYMGVNEDMPEKIKYMLVIKPAIPPHARHRIGDSLSIEGYNVIGGGQMVDGSESDISFEDRVAVGDEE